ncbi:MAG TPA: hypothetical protein DCE42_19995 [Myxococcales bacterium]|mgnify:CR=1 FL=1|nr:hypothetical protein [Deltaproteobacteria bacterium]MBU53706.1 hypothetical protein [Deltaproteobacteria bacterium]HAA57059.1 hypothetical protein [Myxococcales bacterium]|tara:strand:- start:2441 stop:4483 length:2043 start_codon:yes stop_codon:yes gene_type:complete
MEQEYGKSFIRRVHIPLGLLLAGGYLIVLLMTSQMGFCRDEGYYFRAGELYITWVEKFATQVRTGKPLRALQRKEIERYWKYNSEHPPLAKLMMGASWWVFSKKLKWLSNADGFRLPGMFWASLMIFIVFVWGAQAWNLRVGLFAAFALMLMPRFFFHGHLAAFDVPVAALWLLVTYAFWRSMRSPGWGLLTGIFFGLALATKHNSWILPAPLGFYWLCQSWNKFRFKAYPDDSYQLRFPGLPGALFASVIIGPIILFALWPLLWPSNLLSIASWKATTVRYLREYVGFHLHHVHYDAYYFGTLHLKPPFPWHFPFGMTIVTFPLVTVLLALGGTWYMIRQQRLITHAIWWSVRIFQMLFSLLRPIFGLLLSLILFIPLVLLGVLSVVLWVIEILGFLLPGAVGSWVREQSSWARSSSIELNRDLQQFNQWGLIQEVGREYRHRPVGPADKTGLLWLLNASVPMVVIALPSTPIFGGTKHWMPAWPFLALLAGICFERVCASFLRAWPTEQAQRKTLIYAGLGVLFLAPALVGLVRSHPHGLAYYNTLVGGPRGSANWKLQRAFWAPTMRQALPWMNANMKDARGNKKGTVWVHFHDTNWDSARMYVRDGLMSPRIRARWSAYRPTQYMAFIHQKWLRTQLYQSLTLLGARNPVYGVYVDDVPLITFWERNPRPSNHIRW